MELLEQLQKLKSELERQAIEKNESCHILDVQYYTNITFDEIEGKEQPLFLVEKEVNGEIKRELQMGNTVIGEFAEDNVLIMKPVIGIKN